MSIRIIVWYEDAATGEVLCFGHAAERALLGVKIETKVDGESDQWFPYCKECK